MRLLKRSVATAGTVAVLALVTARFIPDASGTVIIVATLVATGSLLLNGLGELRRLGQTHDEGNRDVASPSRRPGDLARFETLFGWTAYDARDFRYQLRPTLRRLIRHRLLEVRGVDIDDPAVDEDRYIPRHLSWVTEADGWPEGGGRAIRTADLEAIVDSIEELR